MTRILAIAVLLSALSHSGMTTENGFGDHPDMPDLVRRFKEAHHIEKQLENIPDRNEQQAQDYQRAYRERWGAMMCVLFWGLRSLESPTPEEVVLVERRKKALRAIMGIEDQPSS